MPAKAESADVVRAKKKLGTLIAKCRGKNMSQRRLAEAVDLPPSNMKYIEDGINCPTANVYSKLISVLKPSPIKRTELDQAYMTIRKTPPPDVCELLISNPNLITILRSMEDAKLNKKEMNSVLASIAQMKKKGETDNG